MKPVKTVQIKRGKRYHENVNVFLEPDKLPACGCIDKSVTVNPVWQAYLLYSGRVAKRTVGVLSDTIELYESAETYCQMKALLDLDLGETIKYDP